MLIRYPGSKGKLATRLVFVIHNYFTQYRNDERIFIEPFAGAAAVGVSLLEKTVIKSFVFNDYDPAMYSIWQAVKEQPQSLINRIEAFTPTVEAFYEFKSFLLTLKPLADDTNPLSPAGNTLVDIAFKKIAVHQMSYSGLGTKSGGPLGGSDQTSDYKIGCRWSPKQLKKEINRINRLMASRKVQVSGLQFYRTWQIESDPLFLYMDPPYYKKGPELYQFCFSDGQHEALAKSLSKTTHPWLLSYDDHPRIRELYGFAAVCEVPLNYTINGSIMKTELLIASKEYEFLLEDPAGKRQPIDIGDLYND